MGPRKLRACRCLEVVVLGYKRSTQMAGLGNCSFGVQTQYAERSSSGRAWKLRFWSTNSVRGTLFQRPGLETALLEYKLSTRNAFQVAGPTLLEYKLSTRNALPVAGLRNCCFVVLTQYVECSSSGRALKLLFWSTNSVRGMLL